MKTQRVLDELFNASEYLDMINEDEQHINLMIQAIDIARELIKTHCINENQYMCNSCHELYPSEEMDFDADDESDLCKNCNHISYNDAPYGDN
jgi:hypothetical protein